jgi:glycosyltransferase involved in cell wall biosynthesis
LITILITTYNCSNYIRYALKSALDQTFNNYEVLVIDDGSNDNTEEIIQSFCSKKLRYEKITHSGRSAALNYGLLAASHDWITLLDADDLITHNKLTLLSGYLNSSNKNIVLTNWYAVFTGNKILSRIKYPTANEDLKKLLLIHSFSNSVLYNKKFILESGAYSAGILRGEDYDLWLRLYNTAEFKCIPEYLNFHRLTKRSFSRKNIEETKQQVRDIQQRHNIYIYDNVIENEVERKDIQVKRNFFYGGKVRKKDFETRYTFIYLVWILPDNIGNFFRIIGIKLILKYLTEYFNQDSIKLRKVLRGFSGDGDKPKKHKKSGVNTEQSY